MSNTSRSRSREYNISTERTLRGRKRKRARYWDMTPSQAIAAGLPLERMTPKVPSQAGGINNNACKIYCGFGNLAVPPTEKELMDFFNVTMVAAQGVDRRPGNSVVNVYISPESRYSFIHFRSREEAAQALDLDGISYRGERLRLGPSHHNGQAPPRLTGIRRLNVDRLKILSTQVPDGPHKIYIGGLPPSLTDVQVKELLSTFGPIKGLFLSKDEQTGLNKGYAFAEYRDHNMTQSAIRGLNGLQVGDRRLTLKIHDSGLSAAEANPARVMVDLGLGVQKTVPPSEVVCFLQMVTESDLLDTQEYHEIVEDIRLESGKFGSVIDIVIPRPEGGKTVPGVGKVFVHMDSIQSTQKVKLALEGRQFLGRTVLATFYDLEKFKQGSL